MRNGWGYNNNRKDNKHKFVDSIYKKFENDNFKVYENKYKLYYGGYYNIIILFNKNKKTIKIIVSGKDCIGNKIKTIKQDITHLKTLKNIKDYINCYILKSL